MFLYSNKLVYYLSLITSATYFLNNNGKIQQRREQVCEHISCISNITYHLLFRFKIYSDILSYIFYLIYCCPPPSESYETQGLIDANQVFHHWVPFSARHSQFVHSIFSLLQGLIQDMMQHFLSGHYNRQCGFSDYSCFEDYLGNFEEHYRVSLSWFFCDVFPTIQLGLWKKLSELGNTILTFQRFSQSALTASHRTEISESSSCI